MKIALAVTVAPVSDSSVVQPINTKAHQDSEVIGSGYFTTTQIPATTYGPAGSYSLPIDKECPSGTVAAASVYVVSSGDLTPLTYTYKNKQYSVGNCAAGRVCLAATVDSQYKLVLYGLASQSDIGAHGGDGEFTASVFNKKVGGFQSLYMRLILAQNACDWAADNQVNRSMKVGYVIYCKAPNSATQGGGEVNPITQQCDNTNEYAGGYL